MGARGQINGATEPLLSGERLQTDGSPAKLNHRQIHCDLQNIPKGMQMYCKCLKQVFQKTFAFLFLLEIMTIYQYMGLDGHSDPTSLEEFQPSKQAWSSPGQLDSWAFPSAPRWQ